MIKQFIKTLSILSIILIGSNTAFASTNFILDTSNQSNIYPIGTSPHGIGVCTSSNGINCTGLTIQDTSTNANGDFVDNVFNQSTNQAPYYFANPLGYLCINDIQGDGSNFYILYYKQGYNVVGSSNVKVVNGVCENVQVITPPTTTTDTPLSITLSDLLAGMLAIGDLIFLNIQNFIILFLGVPLAFYVINKLIEVFNDKEFNKKINRRLQTKKGRKGVKEIKDNISY